MQLYVGDSRSRNGQRAAIAALECGAACEFRKLDLGRGDHKQAEYLAINPLGKIPALIDPDGPGGEPLGTAAVMGHPAVSRGKDRQILAGRPPGTRTHVAVGS